jgi:antirestriction protein ArdC
MASIKIYNMVTERVIEKIEDAIKAAENGENVIAPWHRPWFQSGMPINLVSKKPYRGINVFLLSMMGFASPYFVTFKQAQKLGGKVKKGAKGLPVVFWKWVEMDKDEDGNKLEKKKKIPFLRYYRVFNVDQCEGFEDKIPEIQTREFNPIEDAEKIISDMPNRPEMTHEQARAYYRPSCDIVNMPKHELFESDEEYYSTAFHELIHSTGHTSRLHRKEVMDSNFFGSHDYSIEELAYLKSWLGKLKDDTKLLVMASGRAQKAADYILGKEYKPKDD